jgi:hypothetical protein
VKRRGKLYRIEFEFRASSYKSHHAKGAEIVVCWENDWEYDTRPRKFRHLEIISLKQYVGAQRRVFVVGCNDSLNGDELNSSYIDWNVSVTAEVGDLVLIYRTAPTSAIRNVWRIVDPPKKYDVGNKEGYRPGIQAGLRRVFSLSKPLTYEKLARDGQTRKLPPVRKRFQGKMDITEVWETILGKMAALNPNARTVLRKYTNW